MGSSRLKYFEHKLVFVWPFSVAALDLPADGANRISVGMEKERIKAVDMI